MVDAASVDCAYTDGAYEELAALYSWLRDDVDALGVWPVNG